MSLATELVKPSISTVFLVEHSAALWLRAWVLTASQAVTYEIPLSHHGIAAQQDITVTGVKEAGTALTSQTSIANVESNPGSYFYDSANLKIHVSAATGSTFGKDIVATVVFAFANKAKVINGRHYEPRVASVPDLSLRIEEDFGDPVQIGGGTLAYINNDGFFDKLVDVQWHGGVVTILLGAENISGPVMAYGDYEAAGTWLVDEWPSDRETVEFKLVEIKSRAEKSIPLDRYDRADFPSMSEDHQGEPIPLAFGMIYGASPASIDPGARQFKLCSHAIRQLVEIRVKNENDELWSVVNAETQDLTTGQFTIAAADWETGREVSVDFEGLTDSDGWLKNNPADVIDEILTHIGETDFDTSAFSAAKSGFTSGNAVYGRPVYASAISLYIDEEMTANEAIGKVNAAARTFVFSDASGQWTVGRFLPLPGEGLTWIDGDAGDYLELSIEHRATARVSKAVAHYARRDQDDWEQTKAHEVTAFQRTGTDLSAMIEDTDISIDDNQDARRWAQRRVMMRGPVQKTYIVQMPHTALQRLPGDQIRITETRRSIDEVLEVIEVNKGFGSGAPTVELVCQRNREHGRESGFIVASSDALPARFAQLTGYAAGSITWNASWSATQAILPWARQNIIYQTDANGFADSADLQSHLPGIIL